MILSQRLQKILKACQGTCEKNGENQTWLNIPFYASNSESIEAGGPALHLVDQTFRGKLLIVFPYKMTLSKYTQNADMTQVCA